MEVSASAANWPSTAAHGVDVRSGRDDGEDGDAQQSDLNGDDVHDLMLLLSSMLIVTMAVGGVVAAGFVILSSAEDEDDDEVVDMLSAVANVKPEGKHVAAWSGGPQLGHLPSHRRVTGAAYL